MFGEGRSCFHDDLHLRFDGFQLFLGFFQINLKVIGIILEVRLADCDGHIIGKNFLVLENQIM